MATPQQAVAVLYVSRRGNTRRVAEAIADAVRVRAQPLEQAPPRAPAATLVFVGVPAGAAGLRRTLRALAPRLAGRRAALFCIAMRLPRLALTRLRRLLPGATVVAQRAFRPPLRSDELAEVEAARRWALQVCDLAVKPISKER